MVFVEVQLTAHLVQKKYLKINFFTFEELGHTFAVYIFKGGQLMAISTVFTNNRTQAVRLPAEVRLPEGVKRVNVRAIGNERIIAPVENTWDSFFMNRLEVGDDFMTEHARQEQNERERSDDVY